MKNILQFVAASAVLSISGTPGHSQVNPVNSSEPLPVTAAPEPNVAVVPVGTEPTKVRAVSEETLAVLRDIRSIAPEKEAEIQAALKLESDAEANLILDTILANAKDELRAEKAGRLDLQVVNRTDQDRSDAVGYIARRLRGEATTTEAPASFGTRVVATIPNPPSTYQPRFYGPGRRVITYRSRAEIPPVLLASGQLKRVEIAEVGGSPFRSDLILTDDQPASYIAPDAYAVTYLVDPNTEITRSDILFEQGTTNFLDAYSYDIVADLAAAMTDPSLARRAFIIEGHASAEGEYTANLFLSQARAERIARDLIRFGVPSANLVPVGYGESEAVHPANSPDPLRAQDRRVTVFALRQ